MSIQLQPIGTIFTPFKSIDGMPIQSKGAIGVQGYIEIREEYIPGLKDLEGFSHIHLMYHFHKAKAFKLQIIPFLDQEKRGVFATRAPHRPNAIGLSVVRLLRIEKSVLYIENVDMLDRTPLLDIKPYVPEFDVYHVDSCGWIDRKAGDLNNVKSDKRFE